MIEKHEGIAPQEKTIEYEAIANKNFSLWKDALKTKDPKKVAALYAEDATFLPTVSGEFKKGQTSAEEYFKHFLEKNPTGEIVQEEVQILGENCYLHSGMYNFEVGPDDNRQIIEARFSFAWKKDNQGAWTIIHHHSSIKPKE
jgi:uncharacterized protein (TIGR02246 family)